MTLLLSILILSVCRALPPPSFIPPDASSSDRSQGQYPLMDIENQHQPPREGCGNGAPETRRTGQNNNSNNYASAHLLDPPLKSAAEDEFSCTVFLAGVFSLPSNSSEFPGYCSTMVRYPLLFSRPSSSLYKVCAPPPLRPEFA